jgi:hypothetical protein
LATLELSVKVLLNTACSKDNSASAGDRSRPVMFVQDSQLAALENSKEEATLQLRNYYKVNESRHQLIVDKSVADLDRFKSPRASTGSV